MDIQNTYTSNIAKLLKHTDHLGALQAGCIRPIMCCIVTTHRCQLACTHCCFKNREDKSADMDMHTFEEAIAGLHSLGVCAVEITGGGDPMLWPFLNEGLRVLRQYEMKVGIITNGMAIKNVTDWSMVSWVRVSLNTLETTNLDIDAIRNIPSPSFCYIYHDQSERHIKKVLDFVERAKIPCRIAPDCIGTASHIESLMALAKEHIQAANSEYLFLSDHNIDTERHGDECYLHMIKPFLYLDGNLYACPSAELASENNRQVSPGTRLCHYTEMVEFYRGLSGKPLCMPCSFCKYNEQNRFMKHLFVETNHNEFC